MPSSNSNARVGSRIPVGEVVPYHEAVAGIKKVLEYLGYDDGLDGLEDTPERVVKALAEMTDGYGLDPSAILSKVFEDSYDEVVILRDISFTSLCGHHLLPFSGTVDVGYIPGKVVGLSKLARLVECFARRLQIQERLTRQIAEAIQANLEPKGVAVVVRAQHSCVGCRGIKKPGATMVTSTMLGAFREDASARAEFLGLCR